MFVIENNNLKAVNPVTILVQEEIRPMGQQEVEEQGTHGQKELRNFLNESQKHK